MSMQDEDYGPDSINTLEGLDGVRERPAMYIGSTDEKGLHHLVYEVVDNSVDEAMAGYCDHIDISINTDGSVTVKDNGRGIPVGENSDGEATLEVILTTLHAGGKFDNESYQTSGGLHGVGVSCVNALSERLVVNVTRNGADYEQVYEYGEPVSDIEKTYEYDDDEEYTTGTEITFTPDSGIFEVTNFEFDTLDTRVQELAFLNPGLEISISDEREEDTENSYHYEGGIKEYVEYLNEARETLHDEVIYIEGEEDGRSVEIAMQLTDDVQESIHSFANNIPTREGGTHITGFKTSLTRLVNDYAEENDFLDAVDKLTGADIREGLTAVVSIKHPDPQFEGQTKTKLGNSEMRGIVSGMIHDEFTAYLEQNPDVAQVFVRSAVDAAKARKAASKAKEVARNDASLTSTTLPGKLADCQSPDPSDSELFIVEGDSAGGSAKQARDRETQAVLPLSGKILNVEKHRLERILENDQITEIVKGIGAGIGDEFDIDDVRYESIVIFTDADVDGAHIRTLLLTLFYRHMQPLLDQGMVYAAKPPLYRIKNNGEVYDAMTEEDRERIIEEKCNGNADKVQRFKGLGEMNPDQLWETTMNPENRVLKQIKPEDAAQADKLLTILMGSEVEPRKNFIKENATEAEWVDI